MLTFAVGQGAPNMGPRRSSDSETLCHEWCSLAQQVAAVKLRVTFDLADNRNRCTVTLTRWAVNRGNSLGLHSDYLQLHWCWSFCMCRVLFRAYQLYCCRQASRSLRPQALSEQQQRRAKRQLPQLVVDGDCWEVALTLCQSLSCPSMQQKQR